MTPQDDRRPAFHPRAMLLAGAFGRPLRRAGWGGSLVMAVVVALLASSLRARGVVPVLAVPLAGLAGGLLGTVAGILLVPAADRRAFETFSWLGRREIDRWRARTGGPTPTGAEAAAAFVASVPRAPATTHARIEILAALGRTAEAAAELDLLPAPRTPDEAVEAATLRRYVTQIATGVADDAEVDGLEETLEPGSGPVLELRVARAVARARERLDRGDATWREPLLAERPALGAAATRVVWRDTWRRFAVALCSVGIAFALVLSLVP